MTDLNEVDQIIDKAYRLNLAGRFDNAVRLLDGLLAKDPDHLAALQLKGSALMGLGRVRESEEVLLRGTTLAPDDANSYGTLGLLYRREGRLPEARKVIERALSFGSKNLSLCLLYAEVLETQGELVLAARFLANCASAFPDQPEVPRVLSKLFAKLGDAKNALMASRRWLELSGESVEARLNLAEVASQFARYPLALEQYHRLTELEPENRELWGRLAEMLFECSHHREAVEAFRKSLVGRKPTPEDHITLGRLLLYARDLTAATRELEKGVALDPTIAEGYSTLGRIATIAGDPEAARAHLEAALERNPGLIEAHFYYSRVTGRPADDPVLEQLEAIKETPSLSAIDRVNLGFALGNFYERLGDYDRAFANFAAANEAAEKLAVAGSYRFNEELETKLMKRVADWFSGPFLEAAGNFGSPSEKPVFVIGMPRSGTTLLEQIMGSHSRVEGVGELDDVQIMHRELLSEMEDGNGARLEGLMKEKAADWATRYLKEGVGKTDADRVVDKMPVNFLYAGFIRAMFPKARIIHIHRNPMDTCISIYTNKFSKAYNYARGLESLGLYYRLYVRLMAHWREAMTGPYLEIKYEDLVAEQEANSRRLIDFLGLEWEDACLEFHKTKKQIFTFSSSQVRKPMTASSIERWRRYSDHLKPLQEALGDLAPPE